MSTPHELPVAHLGPRPVLTLTVAALLYAFSIVLIDIAPFFVGMYVDYFGLSLSQAGFVLTVDQAGGVLGAIAGFFLMVRVGWRSLILVATIIATVGNALTGVADGYTQLLLVRFLSGFGVLLVTTVTACVLARAAVPDRMFGIGLALAMGLSAVAVWLLDVLRVSFGPPASLASGALWMGAGVLLCFALPKSLSGSARSTADVNMTASAMATTRVMGRSALIALALFGLSVNVIYGYVERIGVANGLDQSGVARALALGYVFSAVGSLIPGIFGTVGGRLKWIAATTAGFLISLLALYFAKTVPLYTVAFALYASVWNMGLTYYMSLTAENDPLHKYTRAMYIVNVGAQSLGPAIAAAILAGAPLTAIFIVSPVPAVLALVIVLYVAARAARAGSASVPLPNTNTGEVPDA